MGIFGFETYLLRDLPNACPRKKLEELVATYREETKQTSCVAVIDTNFLIRQCLEDLDTTCGGQFKEFQINLLNYIGRLTALGISPVFFLDGSVDAGKMRCWMARKLEMLQRVERVYDDVDAGGNRSCIAAEDCIQPAGMYEATILILKEANYPFFCATSDADMEMARYARENKCFAIMSRDTDFVILRGARFYISLFYKHFRISDMSTYLFDRNAIAAAVGLFPDHLPLLASLLRNDFVDGRYLVPLYSKLLGRRNEALRPKEPYHLKDMVPRLASFIRDELWKQEEPVAFILEKTYGGYPPFMLRDLAHKLGLPDQFRMQNELRRQLETSLAKYEYAPRTPLRLHSPEPGPEPDLDPEVLELARAHHRSVTFLNSAVLSLLTRRTLEMGPALEDPRLPLTCTSETALRPFRRRLYGLLQLPGLFTERVAPNKPVEPDRALYPTLFYPVRPDPEVHPHPGLLALWGERDEYDADLEADQWRLFAWALAAHRPPSARVDALADVLRELPKYLVVPAALVYLLYHSGALEGCGEPAGRSAADLVRLLTRTCMLAGLVPAATLAELRVERYHRTVVHVAALFMRSFTYLSLLNDVLGAPVPLSKLNPALYFNGKLFHRIFTNEQPLDGIVYDSYESIESLILKTVIDEAAEVCVEE
ncbi:Constitutive coactivator of peroxisome proliferator-activated receptor gamma [Frankliniella fusca]|uniref:Constitutive coactivator of peroxisome proliferator-activated receptor gamma n=1 Tax=Frankliniella fusca TaxID=407009 RepID=A0AAE1HDR7_9NEOP|nr:Constitutive coactivator of peroxisome proliferator-activated receptor gamma [Frankliniella fusca]